MTTHHFVEGVKVQTFCLTLLGKARLWYQIIRTHKCRLARFTKLFRQQHSKIGNTREQLLNAWRSFNFDENTETIDAYIMCIRQVATFLGYGEPQILYIFKNILPIKLY